MGEKERDTVGIIMQVPNGDLLLQKKDMTHPKIPGVWCLFGGGLKEGETPTVGIAREMVSETRMTLTNPRLVASYLMVDYPHPRDHEHSDGIEYLFAAQIPGISEIRLREGAGFALYAPSELDEIKDRFIRYDVIRKFLDGGFK